MSRRFPTLTPEEAAAFITDGSTVGFSGFTPAGAAKAVPRALAGRARELHGKGQPFRIFVLTGASTGKALDEELADADAIAWRAPYQSSSSLRKQINSQDTNFLDLHLSHFPQMVSSGFLGHLDFAVVEATEVTDDGRVFLSTSVGASPTFLKYADKIIIEVNRHHSPRLAEMLDIYTVPPPPNRNPIPVQRPTAKIGVPFAQCDPSRILGIVHTDEPDGVAGFDEPDQVSKKIAEHVVRFLVSEMRGGRIPADFLPLQAGVCNVANAVMAGIGTHPDIPPFYMFSEVFQDSLVGLMEQGRLLGASSTSLTLTDESLQKVYGNMDLFGERVVLRPQELSNNPGLIRRLGVIAINTALEFDIYGCVNSTHVCGTQLMNGIGGSGDFARNAYLSFFVAPSAVKDGKISTVVPMCTHVDHNEHTVQILVTEQGLADLRGLGPVERARVIIDHCVHPTYRDYMHEYIETSRMGHIRHDLRRCFELHQALLDTGSMLNALKR